MRVTTSGRPMVFRPRRRQVLLPLSLVLGLPACATCDESSSRDPHHHIDVSHGVVSYNDVPLSWNLPVSTWVAVLGLPSAERVVPSVEDNPNSVEETETTWSSLGIRVVSLNGFPRDFSVRTSGAVISGEPMIDTLLLPGEDGQPTLGVFPGSLIIEGAMMDNGTEVSRVASAFRVRCHPEFSIAGHTLFGWTRGGSCLALDYDTGYYFYNGYHAATESVEYVVGVNITHYARSELLEERRAAAFAEVPKDP